MDLTQGTPQEKKIRAKKMMLWFGIISLIMSFAAITSAFIVSSSREDWLSEFELPGAFAISTVIIVISSITLLLAKGALRAGNRSATTAYLVLTFLLGIGFIVSQIQGFGQIVESGYYFTGESSNVTMSYIYVIAALHILHVIAGLISLFVVIYNHFKQKYSEGQMLGLELASTFWHFVDILWLYLFFFLYFFR